MIDVDGTVASDMRTTILDGLPKRVSGRPERGEGFQCGGRLRERVVVRGCREAGLPAFDRFGGGHSGK